MFEGDDKVSERQHLSKLEHDLDYREAWTIRNWFQQNTRDDADGNRLITPNTKVETPIGRSTYWEGQGGIGFLQKLFLWIMFTIIITVIACMIFGLGWLPPIIPVSAILSSIVVRLIRYKLEGA